MLNIKTVSYSDILPPKPYKYRVILKVVAASWSIPVVSNQTLRCHTIITDNILGTNR